MLVVCGLQLLAQDSSYHHQIGIGVPKLVKHVFSVDENSFLLSYRNTSCPKINFRGGLDFSFTNREDDINYYAVKLGVDTYLKKFKKWDVYTGIDVSFRYAYSDLLKTVNTRASLNVLFGIMYKVSPHFSISTEPYLFFASNYFNDEDTYDVNQKNQKWESFGMGGVGFLSVNFHF